MIKVTKLTRLIFLRGEIVCLMLYLITTFQTLNGSERAENLAPATWDVSRKLLIVDRVVPSSPAPRPRLLRRVSLCSSPSLLPS